MAKAKVQYIETKNEYGYPARIGKLPGKDRDGNDRYVVLQQLRNGEFDVLRMVNIRVGVCSSPMVTCKSIRSAKAWVTRNMLNRESRGA